MSQQLPELTFDEDEDKDILNQIQQNKSESNESKINAPIPKIEQNYNQLVRRLKNRVNPGTYDINQVEDIAQEVKNFVKQDPNATQEDYTILLRKVISEVRPFPSQYNDNQKPIPQKSNISQQSNQSNIPQQSNQSNIPQDQQNLRQNVETRNPYTTYKDYHHVDEFSDDYSPANAKNGTYYRQEAIKRFELEDQIKRDRQKIKLTGKGMAPLDQDDLLLTNNLDVSFTNNNTLATLPNNQKDVRYYQETYRSVNISSRQRQKFNERPVVVEDRETFPNKELWDEFFDPENSTFQDVDLCCFTFNSVLGFDQEFPNFFIREGALWIRTPRDVESNQYRIRVEPAFRHVRYVRLRSVEVPRNLNVINKTNNLILLDVIDPCTGESFPHPDDLPFELILIPTGTYTVETILERIVQLMNQVVQREQTAAGKAICEPFSFFYDPATGEVDIRSDLEFHMRFWFSTTNRQFNLFEMLGYQNPFPVDENGEPAYGTSFSNIIEEPSPLTSLGLINRRPFKKPRLDVIDYIYLAIRMLNVITDDSVTSEDLFAKIPIRGDCGECFIPSTKVFFEPLERLETIDVSWIDAFGNLVEFDGQENSFLLEVVEYQDKIKDSDYSSLRGINNYETGVAKVAYKFNSD